MHPSSTYPRSTFAFSSALALALAGCAGGVPDGSLEASSSLKGTTVVQNVRETRLYMTHYAEFEEPDPGIPNALYIDAATGAPTNELFIQAPLYTRTFTRSNTNPASLTAPAANSPFLPYVISPPGFSGLPTPPEVIGAITSITGLPADVVAANTHMQLVAIGQFLGAAPVSATLTGEKFSMTTTMHFQVKLRVVFLFQPPAGVPAPAVGLLVGFVTRGMLGQLVPALPPAPDPSAVVFYDWSATMTLSTGNNYFRTFASQPPPVADAFESDETAVDFRGSELDDAGNYTIVGSATPANVTFNAPPELLLVLFHTSSLADVEFAIEETGTLPLDN
jgi:hypothetical protein